MGVSNIWKLDKLSLSGTELRQISNQRWDAGITSMLEKGAGEPYDSFRANQSIRPTIQCTTSQLATLLGAIGVGGAAISPVNSYFKLASQFGNVARATTSHSRVACNQTFCFWTRIRLPHNGKAEADLTVQALYDGSNAPFVHTGSVALPGTMTAVSEFFGAGPASINGTAVPSVQEITIDAPMGLIQAGCASEVYDTFTGIETRSPVTVTIRTLEQINWNTYGLSGVKLNGTTGLVFYARKYSDTANRISDATASHIKFTAINGVATPMDSNGNDSSPISDQLKIELTVADETVLPLTGSVSSAIT